MEVTEANSPTEEEEEEEEEGEERTSEPRLHTRSNPEGAEDRALGAQANVGSRSEGEGEAASGDDGVPSAPGAGPKPWQVPATASEVQIRTPRVNCPEKVIICLDLSEEMSMPKLESFNGQQKTELPVTENVQTIPPPYVVRTILVYSRLPCQPQFSLTEPMKKMFQCPYFFFDIVYIHNGAEEKEDEMSWKDMFAFMGSLDTKGTSYKYEVALAGPALELHNCMAKLLAHPLQRPCQTHASYSLLEEDEEAAEGEAIV
ncbi:BRISC and BRCA1-A complex member 1 isoform X3 [Meriones unguiculatus]|uniref:BRISC and BRCA1-A complex member 1 isoform X3 n=1 Tax=Meriones unguiculatus TaxID=10047 RepID=UPI00293E75F3|nr:BRISC and BRCA1-A complex member 1 isoform X3 [Meriones unguiculatus]